MNPPVYPISPEGTKRKSIIMTIFFSSIVLVIGFFLIVELLDRTLRDKIRAKHLTSTDVIGAFPGNDKIRFRNFTKIRNQVTTKHLSNAILCYLPNDQNRIINLVSTENKDGKTFIGEQLEEYWTSIGLSISRLTWHSDFQKDSKEYLLAQSIKDLSSNNKNADIIIVEYPPLNDSNIPTSLLKEASINLVVAKAKRTWKFTDQLLLNNVKSLLTMNLQPFLY
jgi:hypothetical protein